MVRRLFARAKPYALAGERRTALTRWVTRRQQRLRLGAPVHAFTLYDLHADR